MTPEAIATSLDSCLAEALAELAFLGEPADLGDGACPVLWSDVVRLRDLGLVIVDYRYLDEDVCRVTDLGEQVAEVLAEREAGLA